MISILPSLSSTHRTRRLVHAADARRTPFEVPAWTEHIRDWSNSLLNALVLGKPHAHGLTHLIWNSTHTTTAFASSSRRVLCSLQWLFVFTFIRKVSDDSSTTRIHLTSLRIRKHTTWCWGSETPRPNVQRSCWVPESSMLFAKFSGAQRARVMWSVACRRISRLAEAPTDVLYT